VYSCRLDILERAFTLNIDLLTRERPHDPRRNTRDERLCVDDLTRPHDRTRSNKRVLPNLGSIEDDRADANQRSVTDPATVNNGPMSDGDLVAEQCREIPSAHVKGGLILDIRPLTDTNPFDIAAQNRSKKNARISAYFDVSDNRGAWSHPDTFMQVRA
jgi:hypothetical protein